MFAYFLTVLSALLLCYFLSRALLLTSVFAASDIGLRFVHLASFALLLVLVLLLKYPEGFDRSSPFLLALSQLACYFYDRQRGRWPGPVNPE